MAANYLFRAHHLMCNYCFIGKGYNDKFIQNFKTINQDLKANPHKVIQIIAQTDNICNKCSYNMGKTCSSEDKISVLDKAHQDVLGVSVGQELSWNEAKYLIENKVTFSKFSYMCSTCEWYHLGICYDQLFINNREYP